MVPKDQEAIACCTPKGIFSYKLMPFALNNAGVTYQRAIQLVFHYVLHKKVEGYVNDLVVKFKKREYHV